MSKVSVKVLLREPKFQLKILSCSSVFVQPDCREKHPSSKGERLRNIGHNLSMVLDTRKSSFGWRYGLQFHI